MLFVFFPSFYTFYSNCKNNINILNNKELKETPKIVIEPPKTPKPVPLPYEKILLSKMTNEEKVGQLFIWGVEGTSQLTPESKEFLNLRKSRRSCPNARKHHR